MITAIAHPLRRRIVDRLLLHGASQVGALARAFDVQVGSVSHHLRMLQKAGVVEQVEPPDGDRRSSWWQLARRSFTWSDGDFDSPADVMIAREAQRANVRHQLQRLQQWHRASTGSHAQGFSTDTLAWATPQELRDLHARVNAAVDEWKRGIDTGDGDERMPVFFFAHGFPTQV